MDTPQIDVKFWGEKSWQDLLLDLILHFPQLLAPCHWVFIQDIVAAAADAKSIQSCLTLCNPVDGSPPSSSIPGILQARILEWVAICFSSACMHAFASVMSYSVRPHGQRPTRLLCPRDSLGQNTAVGCHVLLLHMIYVLIYAHRKFTYVERYLGI